MLNPPVALGGFKLHVGDLNEDGRDDHQAPPTGGWDLYETRILDVNGDGKDDIVWAIPQGDLTIHVGLAR